ncbi:unnamed protein product [Rhizophagus irregularis]|uniref:Uncharacterized protein n=1 Tax=Rhizophagus irregularis TaxID=588596 RepID=A0A915YQY5_9GLOM|nr:unnamed protein product [Rhizophagus irregularis]
MKYLDIINITESYTRTLYSPSLEDIEYINNLQALHDIFNTKLKNKYYYLNNKEQTFLCINLDTNYDEKDGESDESISSETTSCGYDTSTSISTSTFSNDDYSTIDTFADHGLGVIWTNTKEHGEFGTIIVDYYFLKKFFDFND